MSPAKARQKRPAALIIIGGTVLLMLAMGALMRPHEYAQGKADTVTWKQLAKGVTEGAGAPVYAKDVAALDGQDILITGYMFPFDSAENQSHFLLSAYPPTCPFCLPGGPSELIEVKAAGGAAIPYTTGPTTLRGKFHANKEMQDGMLYAIEGAKAK